MLFILALSNFCPCFYSVHIFVFLVNGIVTSGERSSSPPVASGNEIFVISRGGKKK